MRVMRDLTAGNTVNLRVWTGSGYRDVQVTTARYADVYKNQRLGGMFHPGEAGAFGFAPALEALRMTGPDIRRMELRTPDVRRIEVRPTPSTPSATPRIISVPSIAPTRAGVRRYTI